MQQRGLSIAFELIKRRTLKCMKNSSCTRICERTLKPFSIGIAFRLECVATVIYLFFSVRLDLKKFHHFNFFFPLCYRSRANVYFITLWLKPKVFICCSSAKEKTAGSSCAPASRWTSHWHATWVDDIWISSNVNVFSIVSVLSVRVALQVQQLFAARYTKLGPRFDLICVFEISFPNFPAFRHADFTTQLCEANGNAKIALSSEHFWWKEKEYIIMVIITISSSSSLRPMQDEAVGLAQSRFHRDPCRVHSSPPNFFLVHPSLHRISGVFVCFVYHPLATIPLTELVRITCNAQAFLSLNLTKLECLLRKSIP